MYEAGEGGVGGQGANPARNEGQIYDISRHCMHPDKGKHQLEMNESVREREEISKGPSRQKVTTFIQRAVYMAHLQGQAELDHGFCQREIE